MQFKTHIVWQALLAALTLFSSPALAEVTAEYEPSSGTILVKCATVADSLHLTVAGQSSDLGMPLSVARTDDGLIVSPRFSLQQGTDYAFSVGKEVFSIAVPKAQASTPRVIGFSPSQAVIPANTLRIYVSFSEPMQRGQLLQHIRLINGDGSEVVSPFLNLETELWDPDQRRATLLLDPGRIKQGVGSNVTGGAPLQEGESYQLVVSKKMQSADGIPLSSPVSLAFRVGPPERRGIDVTDWEILSPKKQTQTPLSIGFDRIMDIGAVVRLVTLESPDGSPVVGQVTSDGGGWSIAPTLPWTAGVYRLIVDPELEDVSGNTPGVPFDAGSGTIGTQQNRTVLTIEIANN